MLLLCPVISFGHLLVKTGNTVHLKKKIQSCWCKAMMMVVVQGCGPQNTSGASQHNSRVFPSAWAWLDDDWIWLTVHWHVDTSGVCIENHFFSKSTKSFPRDISFFQLWKATMFLLKWSNVRRHLMDFNLVSFISKKNKKKKNQSVKTLQQSNKYVRIHCQINTCASSDVKYTSSSYKLRRNAVYSDCP